MKKLILLLIAISLFSCKTQKTVTVMEYDTLRVEVYDTVKKQVTKTFLKLIPKDSIVWNIKNLDKNLNSENFDIAEVGIEKEDENLTSKTLKEESDINYNKTEESEREVPKNEREGKLGVSLVNVFMVIVGFILGCLVVAKCARRT